jgi:hypothetical protein
MGLTLKMAAPSKTLEEILAQARRLPEDQQQRLVAELRGDLGTHPSQDRRQNAMKRWLARAGSGHVDATDISSSKNKYLAEIYATKS